MQQSSCLSLPHVALAGCHLPYLTWLLNPLFSLWVPTAQLEERAEQIRSKSYLIQVEREKMQMELMGPIFTKIKSAVESVGKEGGFSLIQDYNPQMTLYFAAPTVDVTGQVKAKLGIK